MIYNERIFNILNNTNVNFANCITNSEKQLKKISGTGVLRLLKKILTIFPQYRSKQNKKIAEVYRNSLFHLEVLRDRKEISTDNKLNNGDRHRVHLFLKKIDRFAAKHRLKDLQANIIAYANTILHNKSAIKIKNSKITQKDLLSWCIDTKKSLMKNHLIKYIENKNFEPTTYFNDLRNLPEPSRLDSIDTVFPLNIGFDTKYLEKSILPDIQEKKGREYFKSLLEERKALVTSDEKWNKAIDKLENDYIKATQKIEEATEQANAIWKTLEKDYKEYIHLLEDPQIQKDFIKWVFRDKLDPTIFFESPTCSKLMTYMALPEHIATCGEKILLKDKTPHIKKEGHYTPWTDIPWSKVFVANEFKRESLFHLDKKLRYNKTRDYYFMPEKGLTKQNPLDFTLKDFEQLKPFKTVTITVPSKEAVTADITPIVTSEGDTPNIIGTHAYIELRIPKGEAFQDTETGEWKVEMNVYPFGVASDPHIQESQLSNISYVVRNLVPSILKNYPVELYMPDQNEFYRTRKYTKLKKRIAINNEHLNNLLHLFKTYQKSKDPAYQGKDKKIFHIALRNCSQLPSDVYQAIGKEPLPRTIPIHHLIPKGSPYAKFLHQSLPTYLRKKIFHAASFVLGGRTEGKMSDLNVVTTWLQQACIALENENNRYQQT